MKAYRKHELEVQPGLYNAEGVFSVPVCGLISPPLISSDTDTIYYQQFLRRVILVNLGVDPMGWACGRMGERGVYRVLVGKPEGKRPMERPRRRWVDNIRMDLQEVGCGYMDCIGLAQERDRWRTLVSAVMNLRVP